MYKGQLIGSQYIHQQNLTLKIHSSKVKVIENFKYFVVDTSLYALSNETIQT